MSRFTRRYAAALCWLYPTVAGVSATALTLIFYSKGL